MLTFEEKLAIIASFPELSRKDVSLGRVNFHYEASAYDKKTVVYHLHPNGNGYVYGGHLEGISTDDKGFINIRDYDADDLRALVKASIRSLTQGPAAEQDSAGSTTEERWIGENKDVLLLVYDDDMWYLYAGLNLESAFETYEEAQEYLQEEGFTRQ